MKRKLRKRVKVTVTKRDIQRGKTEEPKLCPIALAIKRVVPPRVTKVWEGVMRECVDWDGAFVEALSDLPQKATKFIDRFDDEEQVKPFSFVLKLPQR